MMKLTRRSFLAGVALAAVLDSVPAWARTPATFEPGAFAAAQAAGRPILVHVATAWCEICQQQKPIVAKLLDKPEFAGMAAFEVDFDKQGGIVRGFNVQQQSTLIVFKGKKEVVRSVGATDPVAIEALLHRAL
jgi:thioredoxin 1